MTESLGLVAVIEMTPDLYSALILDADRTYALTAMLSDGRFVISCECGETGCRHGHLFNVTGAFAYA